MKTQAKPKLTYQFRLVKWDGPPPEVDPPKPELHPDCEEIREWKLGQPNRIVYKRQ